MKRYTWLFELDDKNATDADYEDGTGDGQYVVYEDGIEVVRFDTLDETEFFIKEQSQKEND